MTEAPKFNLRNPAVKRIMQEMKEIKQDTSGEFIAEALETDIFEWHFVIRGPRDTEFEGGIYHGRILLPAEYPFKPPSFMMLSPNGRFETGVKICLSISSHHPEHWQPSWSVRTALTALIAFMPSPGAGALGALDFPKEERRQLAARSRAEPPRFGSAERQRVIEEMHARMLALAAQKDAERAAAAAASGSAAQDAAAGEAGPAAEPGARPAEPSGTGAQPAEAPQAGAGAGSSGAEAGAEAEGPAGREAAGRAKPSDGDATGASAGTSPAAAVVTAAAADAAADRPRPSTTRAAAAAPASTSAPAAARALSAAPAPPASAGWAPVAAVPVGPPAALAAAAAGPTSTDHMLTALMWALYVGIGAILLRKVMGAMGVDLQELMAELQDML